MSDCPSWMKGHQFQNGWCECGYQDIVIHPPLPSVWGAPPDDSAPLFPAIVSTDVLIAEVRKKAIADVAQWLAEQGRPGGRRDFEFHWLDSHKAFGEAAQALLEGKGPK